MEQSILDNFLSSMILEVDLLADNWIFDTDIPGEKIVRSNFDGSTKIDKDKDLS